MTTAPPTRRRPADDDFTWEVRAMLARRAGDVEARDLSPELPSGLRIEVGRGHDRPGSRSGRPRLLALAAGLVVAVLAVGLAVRAGPGDGGDEARTGPTPTSVPGPARLEVFAGLPDGVDPLAGPPLFVGDTHGSPERAHRAATEPAFGEQVTPPAPVELVARDDVWTSWYESLVAVDERSWPGAPADAGVSGGVVAVRRDPGSGEWGPVAVTSSALDLSGVSRSGSTLSGLVRSPDPVPLRLVVSTLDGTELSTSSLTTTADSIDPSFLRITDLDVGSGPVVVRAEAGDRPGQMGLDGVRVAAVATVALPPPAAWVEPPR